MTRSQRITVVVAGSAILFSTLLIGHSLLNAGLFRPSTPGLDTPGWKVAQELSAKLYAEHSFVDVGFAVVTESPLKFEVVGAVYSPADMERLKARLKELRPEEDYELNVELMRK